MRGTTKLDVLANDSPATDFPIAITAASPPAKGKASIIGGKMISYTPGKTFDGTDSFTYRHGDDHGTGVVQVRGGGIADIDAEATVSTADKIAVVPPNANTVKATVTRASGLIGGSFIPDGATKAVKFFGVEHQGENRAAGFFIGAAQSGTVELKPH
ncbi:MAG: Ig-like domain-containing protein [Chthoniobacteraceae bacterium]